jgi:hypothetical protein
MWIDASARRCRSAPARLGVALDEIHLPTTTRSCLVHREHASGLALALPEIIAMSPLRI